MKNTGRKAVWVAIRWFRLNLGKSIKMIIYVPLLTTFEARKIFPASLVLSWNWLEPKSKPPYGQVKLVQITDTHVSTLTPHSPSNPSFEDRDRVKDLTVLLGNSFRTESREDRKSNFIFIRSFRNYFTREKR